MSDFEVNKAVAEKLGFNVRVSSWAIAGRDESTDYADFLKSDVYYINTPRGNSDVPNYCNNPSDAWPIIIDSKITLTPWGSNGDHWKATNKLDWNDYSHDDIYISDKNPLRAAMIVFLMMQ